MKRLSAQTDLFGDAQEDTADDVSVIEREPAPKPTAQPAVAPDSESTKKPEPPVTTERYEGWVNSATYLADLYIAQSSSAMQKIRALIDDACVIDERKLAKMFQVSVMPVSQVESDDYATGLIGDRLVLDYWAKGNVDWKEIALHIVADERRELGLKSVEEAVLHAIGTATVEGNVIRLNTGQLPRDVYAKVDRVLRLMGGRWTKRLGGHLYSEDPTEKLETLLLTGRIEKPDNFGAFFTPDVLADEVIELADLEPGLTVLEPSAGAGALLSRAAEVVGIENCVAVELQQTLADQLRARGFEVIQGDFLSRPQWHSVEMVDRIVMNPPFSRQADVDHVMHAYSMLAPGGRLVAIMSAGVSFRTNAKTEAFRALLNDVGSIKPNPDGSFKESGTSVSTVIVVLNKPR